MSTSDFDAVDFRHKNVKEDDIGCDAVVAIQNFARAGDLHDSMAHVGENPFDEPSELDVIVHDDNRKDRHFSLPP